jgi:hypothetical protein
MRGAVRVVLDTLDGTLDAVLVTLEVDDAVLLVRTAALVTGGDATVAVAPTGLALAGGERLVRPALPQVRLVDLDDEPGARRRRFHLDECHQPFLDS